ncbi:MAG: DinB family protein [Gemmatimonadales bacterium]|nr:DinB family protein [Gemmatimonadales bacterium]
MNNLQRPGTDEYADEFAPYVDLVDPGQDNILVHVKAQGLVMLNMMRSLDEETGNHRYAAGKWSLKELIGHLIDMERIFTFRALWMARADNQAQPGVDENAWAAASNAGHRTLAELWREQHVCRTDHLYLFKSLDESAWERRGIASGNPLSVRAIPWIIAGHEKHHMLMMKKLYGLPVPG